MLPVAAKSTGLKDEFDWAPELAPKAGVAATLKASACAAASESRSSEWAELRPVRVVVTDYFCPKLLFFKPGIPADAKFTFLVFVPPDICIREFSDIPAGVMD